MDSEWSIPPRRAIFSLLLECLFMHLNFSFSSDVLYTLTDLGIHRSTKVTSTSAQVSCVLKMVSAFVIIKIYESVSK